MKNSVVSCVKSRALRSQQVTVRTALDFDLSDWTCLWPVADEDESLRLMPGNAPIPEAGPGTPQEASTSSTFQDFVPPTKLVTADLAYKAESSKSPISAKSLKSMWKRVRTKNTSTSPKAQAVVNEAIGQANAESKAKTSEVTDSLPPSQSE